MEVKDPRKMSRLELILWLREFLNANTKMALQDISEQWDIHDKINDMMFQNHIKDTSKVQFKSSKTKFMKVYYKEIFNMFDENKIDAPDIGYIILLGNFIDYEDNTLKNEDGTYMSTDDIRVELKMSNSTIKRFLKRIIDSKIIFKKLDETDKYKRKNKYYVNPHVIFKGKYIDKKIKDWLDGLKNGIKSEGGNSSVISLLDRLQEEDYSNMNEEEIDIISEELYQLVM